MSIIGITGRISSGKSTVAGFMEKNCPDMLVLDVDKIAKGLYEEHPEIKDELRRVFGESITGPDKRIYYDRLARIVFSNKSALFKLNRIMFPRLRMEIKRMLKANRQRKHIIIDAAVLFDAKLDVVCDYIILVESDEKTRKTFLKNKKLDDNEIELKIKGQHIEINIKNLDYTIINDGNIKKLLHESIRILDDIESREKKDATGKV